MSELAVVVDDFALATLPRLEQDLAQAGAMVMRAFKGLPNPNLLRRHRGVAVVGGPHRVGLLSRLELATATVPAPVVAALPIGLAASPDLRGPGVVDLVPAGTRGAAERILLMAQVPIVSGRSGEHRRLAPAPALPGPTPLEAGLAPDRRGAPDGVELVAVASSTGGVWVLAALLRELPARGRAVLVAQHMEGTFAGFLADWLRDASGWPAVLVSHPVPLSPGTVYVAAAGMDLGVEAGRVRAMPASSRHVPSGDRLFREVAAAAGPDAVGVVLSGMGSDGAEGLAEIVRSGGRALCQEPASAVVPSMPQAALRRNPGALAVPPQALAAAVARRPPFGLPLAAEGSLG